MLGAMAGDVIGSAHALTPKVREEHTAYIESWLIVLRQDKRAIFTAAARAQRAVDFLHGLQPDAKQVDAA